MLRLFSYLFLGHVHTWETIETLNITRTERGHELSIAQIYVQRCTTCGNIKSTRINANRG